MNILGISAFYHDSACVLLSHGEIIAAAQEERFTRKKHDSRFPHLALEYCLSEGAIQLKDIDYVVFYDKPFLKFERLLETYMAFAPKGLASFSKALPVWVKDKLFQKAQIKKELQKHFEGLDLTEKLLFSEHHQSHAASAFYPSPFEEAAILTMDGVGEWTTTSLAIGKGNHLSLEKEIHFPHSLGLLYSAFTYYCGFKVNSGEYKLMGLAPYGEPRYANQIKENLIDIKEDGSFRLNMEYFDFCTGLRMTNEKFDALFGAPARKPESEDLTQRHMDLAASIQEVTEEIVIKLSRAIAKETGMKNLCLAGGVALNCVANGKLLKENIFENIFVQPAAGDSGGALGAALLAWYHLKGNPRVPNEAMKGAYLGPSFEDEIQATFDRLGANYIEESEEDFLDKVSDFLKEGKAIGWYQGRMEYGPRALGNRSIIADPRNEEMQKKLNLKVKFRESFRPFAPSVLREDVSEYFDIDSDSPYMLIVANIKEDIKRKMTNEEEGLFGIEKLNIKRSSIPAITHVDYSARIQTVHKETNPKYHTLISKFKEKTDCSVVVNTSFNVRGEPIVCTPEDAFRCFMGTDLDILAIGNFILEKEKQNPILKERYESKFELD